MNLVIDMQFFVDIIPWSNGNRPGTKLTTTYGVWITVHETANPAPSADAFMHRTFTHNGGGKDEVSFHFAVDDQRAVQLLPLDEIGYHAGDGCNDPVNGVGPEDFGCFSSIAIETCVNAGSNWAQTKKNLVELITMILKGDSRINWGDGRAKDRVSSWRIAQHNAWSGKHCPTRIRNEGSWNTILGEVRAAIQKAPIKYTPPLPIPSWDGQDKKVGNTVWYALRRIVKLKGDTIPRAWASSNKDEAKAGDAWKEGKEFLAYYIVQNGSRQWWYVSADGFRILMSKCHQQFRPRKYEV